jgi:DNA-binding NarL/FixJ family response regulator
LHLVRVGGGQDHVRMSWPQSGVPSPVRVLVVDDDATLRAALHALLDADPAITVVGEVADGADAITAVADLSPDLVIVDINMPGGGPELVRTLSAQRPPARVIVYSASDAHRSAMFGAGAVDYLAKGDPPSSLIAAIKHWPAVPPAGADGSGPRAEP